MERSRAKANRVLPRKHTGHSKHPLPTTQEKTLHVDITRLSTPKSDYILCSQRWRNSMQSAKTRLGADCGSYHELLIVKFRLKLKKVGKTTRPFRYDLNQIPYRVEVRNLSDRQTAWWVMDGGSWHCTGEGIKTIPMEKKWKKVLFIPIPKKDNIKECSNYHKLHSSHTLAKQCSKSSKSGFNTMWSVNFQMFKLDLEKAEKPETKLPTSMGSLKNQESSRKTSVFYWLYQSLDCVDHNKLWKILQEMGKPEYLIYLLRNLYAGQETS